MAEPAPELEAVAVRLRDELARVGVRVERMLAFGSYARGEQREGSDIDLIVVSPDWAGLSRRERLEMLGVAAAHILEPIQALGFTPEEIASGGVSQFWRTIIEQQAVPVL
jgi:predicted nucleotidyltransferase